HVPRQRAGGQRDRVGERHDRQPRQAAVAADLLEVAGAYLAHRVDQRLGPGAPVRRHAADQVVQRGQRGARHGASGLAELAGLYSFSTWAAIRSPRTWIDMFPARRYGIGCPAAFRPWYENWRTSRFGSAARSEFALWQQVDPKPSTTSTAPLIRPGPVTALALAVLAP